MPLTFSTEGILKKNALTDNGAWLLLVSVEYESETPVRAVYNNEQIIWPTVDGNIYYPVDFKLDAVIQSTEGGVPSTKLSFLDIERRLIPILNDNNGAVGADVYVYLVHSSNLDEATPEMEEHFNVMSTSIGGGYIIQFELGSENLANRRIPQDRILKDHCRYKEFKGDLCGYTGVGETCNHTFANCIFFGNEARFGGAPGCGVGGYLAPS